VTQRTREKKEIGNGSSHILLVTEPARPVSLIRYKDSQTFLKGGKLTKNLNASCSYRKAEGLRTSASDHLWFHAKPSDHEALQSKKTIYAPGVRRHGEQEYIRLDLPAKYRQLVQRHDGPEI
jgi:hypothetical protein